MLKRLLFFISISVIISLGQNITAQGVFSEGTASYEFKNEPPSISRVDFDPGNGNNQVYDNSILYRIGSGDETVLRNPTSQSYIGDEAIITFSNVDDLGFDIIWTLNLDQLDDDPSEPQTKVVQTVEVINNTGDQLAIEVFNYLDLDKQGTASEDGSLFRDFPSPIIEVKDSDTGYLCYFGGTGANAYQVVDCCNFILDGVSTNLDNSGLPFTGGEDWTGAFQWSLSIADGESQSVESALSTFTADVVQPIPTMSEWGLFLFFLVMLNVGVVFVWNYQRKLALSR
jgi:hypothetical protein